jgi:hypothetical protein
MRQIHYLERLHSKTDIINWLGWQYGYTRYLEIATSHTGLMFGRISAGVYSDISRVLYHAPLDFDDGHTITCRDTSTDSTTCLTGLIEAGRRFDVVFIDGYHEYASSRRDLELGLQLLAPGGMLVAHDCYPLHESVAVPHYIDGGWMGVSYLAFLDLAKERPDLVHNVIDLDWGCGLLYPRQSVPGRVDDEEGDSPREALLSVDYHDWRTFQDNAPAVLNLISAQEFLRRYRQRPPSLATRTAQVVVPIVKATGLLQGIRRARRIVGR